MIPLKKAIRIYNEKSKDFWNFMAKQVLEIEKSDFIPDFIRKAFTEKIVGLKVKMISERLEKSEIISKVKKILESKRAKHSTIFLIKYVWPKYEEYLKEKDKKEKSKVILKEKNITIKINKIHDPGFDFYSYNPFYKLRLNAKTRSVMIETLCTCSESESKSRYWWAKDLFVDYKIVNYENFLILLFRYHVTRRGANYRYYFSHDSNYSVVKGLYVIKEPFHVVETEERFFYHPKDPSPFEVFDLKKILKKFKPEHEEDKAVFKNLSSSLKKREPTLLYEKTGSL